MKFRLATLFLPLCLFVLPTNRAEACGSDDADHAAKFHEESSSESCCGDSDDGETSCENHDTDSGCPCDHGNDGCHCPGCQIVVHSAAAFTLEAPPALAAQVLNFSVQKQAFYFSDHLPEAVYLPIWQPPKLAA